MSRLDGDAGGELLRARLGRQAAEEIGRVVDDSFERAAAHRAERARRDRLEREAEERERRLEHFRAMEAEDARRLYERDRIDEDDASKHEARRDAEQRAQIVADQRRRDELFA